jgi:protein-L-isoaspartate O-methyltransferase
MRRIRGLAELDAEIARLDALPNAARFLAELRAMQFELPWTPPAVAPESSEYRDAVLEAYKLYSGRQSYDPLSDEMTACTVDERSVQCPHPYSSGSSLLIGEHLMAIGFLMRALDLAAGMHILEFGPGWGNTTVEFARMGCPVTAVDINPDFLNMVEQRTRGLTASVETVNVDMLAFRPSRRYDRIVFFECFHHCSDPIRLVDRLAEWLTPDGKVVFAGEPITDGFTLSWGLRTDGQSAYSIRKFGWLELGFNASFFTRLLTSRGWDVARSQSLDQMHINVFSAVRTDATMPRAA